MDTRYIFNICRPSTAAKKVVTALIVDIELQAYRCMPITMLMANNIVPVIVLYKNATQLFLITALHIFPQFT